jgi:hypothetical protein
MNKKQKTKTKNKLFTGHCSINEAAMLVQCIAMLTVFKDTEHQLSADEIKFMLKIIFRPFNATCILINSVKCSHVLVIFVTEKFPHEAIFKGCQIVVFKTLTAWL